MTALIALRVGRTRMTLYGIRISTTRKIMSIVLELSLSPTLTDNLFIPNGQVVCPLNPTKGIPMASKSFSMYCNFLKHSSVMISTELPVSTNIRRTMASAISSYTTNGSLYGACNGRMSSGPKVVVGPTKDFNSVAVITWLSCQIRAFLYLALIFLTSMRLVIIAMTTVS